MSDKTLEADGYITIYEIGTSHIVAQYEGLEVHRAMSELAALRAVAVAAADFRTAWANGDEDTETYEDILDDKLAAARAAGYLPTEGVAS